MNNASKEWCDRVAAQNKIEVAKARFTQPDLPFGGSAGESAASALTQEQRDLRDSPLGMTLGLFR